MANYNPIFIGTIHNTSVPLQAGATNLDGTGSSLLYAAGVAGSRLHALVGVYATTVTTGSVLRFFVRRGTTYSHLAEVVLPVFTRSAGVPSPTIDLMDLAYMPFLDAADKFITLQAGEELWVAVLDTLEAELTVTAFGGDY